jgi:membrane-associated phospholipid phosphatase
VTRFDFSEDLLLPWVRWSTGFAVSLVFGTGYYLLDLHLSKALGIRIYDFSLPLDERIPFVAWTIWAYALYYPFCFVVLPLLTSRERFGRVALAYFLEFALASACFILFPSRLIRPTVAGTGLSAQALQYLHEIDPGYHVFPSLHVANVVLVVWVFIRYRSPLAWPVLVLAVLISASTVLVKAHYLLDIPGGVGLAFVSIHLAWWGAKKQEKN